MFIKIKEMFKWKKLGRIYDPKIVKNKDWMNGYAQSASTLIFDDFIRVYFACRSKQDVNGQFLSYLTYIDINKLNLFEIINIAKEPLLELGGLGTFDEFGTNPASVIKVGDEVRIYYCGWSRCESVPFNSAIGVARSFDNGNTFTKIGKGPVLSYTPNEPFLLGSPKIKKFNDTWYLWYAAGSEWIKNVGKPEPVYKIRVATSKDGINWFKKEENIIEAILEKNECQASADVLYHEDKYHMFFSYRNSLNYRQKHGGYRIGYAASNDLQSWKRDDSKAGISISNEGWDSQMVSYSHIFKLKENIYMIYQGNHFGRDGLGLALLTK